MLTALNKLCNSIIVQVIKLLLVDACVKKRLKTCFSFFDLKEQFSNENDLGDEIYFRSSQDKH